MALLLLVAALWERAGRLRCVSVLSVDHGLRTEAASEAAHAIRVARAVGCGAALVQRVAVASHGNILDAARTARLEAIAGFAREQGASHAVLAHHADDRAEGLLLALARGAGIEAAANLLPSRESQHGIVLARPLLDVRRGDLHAFLVSARVPWAEDPSNRTRARGAMRVDPSLSALVDRIAGGAGDFLDDAAELHALRETLAHRAVPEGAVAMERAAFDALPRSVRSACVVRLVRHAGGTVLRRVVESVVDGMERDRHPRAFPCGGGVTLVFDGRSIRAIAANQPTAD